MVDPHCEIMWANTSVSGLGRYPTADYGAAKYNAENQAIITQSALGPRC